MISTNPTALLCDTRTSTGTVITVPAGTIWSGHLVISASHAVAGNATPRLTVNGTNAEPASGTVVHQLSLTGLALATITDSCMTELLVRAPAGNDVTIDFNTGGASSASATVNGFYN